MTALETTVGRTRRARRRTSATFLVLVRRGLRDRRRAPLTWGGSLGAFAALIVGIWPSVQGSISKAVATYPEALKQAFGIERLDTVEAYLQGEVFSLILPLATAFLGVRIVATAVSDAEERGYLDTLLAAPVSRRALVAGAYAVVGVVSATVLLIVSAAAWLTSILAGSDLALGSMLMGCASVWSLAMLAAGFAAFAAGGMRRAAAVTGVTMSILVAMYTLDVVGRIADGLGSLRWASAFKYYGAAVRDGLDPLAFAGLIVAGGACAAAGAALFDRRDIR